MAALAELVEMEVSEKEAKLEAFEQMVARGEYPTTEQTAELDKQFTNSMVDAHIEKVSNLTKEPEEVIQKVFGGVLAHLRRIAELTREMLSERHEKERIARETDL